MKIDLSQEQGALVPLYFFRKPLGWPAEYRREQNTATLPNSGLKAPSTGHYSGVGSAGHRTPKLGGTAPSTKRLEENEK